MLDKSAHPFFSEDLSVLEALADGVARRFHALAGAVAPGAFALVVADVFTREGIDAIIAASLRRARRRKTSVELAQVDVGGGEEQRYRDCAAAIYDVVGRRAVAIGEYSRGVLALIVGGGNHEPARLRMDRALASVLARIPEARGAGVVTFRADSQAHTLRLVDAPTFAAMADEARMHAIATRGVHRVALGVDVQSNVDAVADAPAQA